MEFLQSEELHHGDSNDRSASYRCVSMLDVDARDEVARTQHDYVRHLRAIAAFAAFAYAGHLSLHQLKVMSAIEQCRTATLGGHTEACTDCGYWRVASTPAATFTARRSGRRRAHVA